MSFQPSNNRNGEIEHAIELLRSLIEKTPSNPNHRLRLLKLLRANGRRYDFIVEAHRYRDNCDLTFDTNWTTICEMGQELDPGNEFFGKARRARKQPDEQSSEAPAHEESKAAPNSGGAEAAHPEPNGATDNGAPQDGLDRRDFMERRLEDRRKAYSAWFGEERRKFQQRQKRRRTEDREKRPKR